MPKKKLHIIAPYPKGEAPSQRFRFEQYFTYLEKNGFEIHYHSFHTLGSWKRLYSQGKFLQKTIDLAYNFSRRWILMVRLIPAKHLFIHREVAHIGPPLFEWLLSKIWRKKYHLDFDDAIWIPNYSAANARFQKLKCFWKAKYIMKWAGSISAGNDYLVQYAQQFNGNVHLIPTTIDTVKQHCQLANHSEKKVIVGWTGTHSTMHYLTPLFPILKRLANEFDFEFHVISNKKPEQDLPFMIYKEWNLASEISDLAAFHIGLMPLVEDQWSSGKCGFKALQYMALGSVAIVTPVGVNTHIVQHGVNGFLATTENDWETNLRQLLTNQELRQKIGTQARKTIEEHWSVNAWEARFLAYLNSISPTHQ